MKLRLATLLVLVWSIVLLAVANVGVAGDFDYTAPSGTPDADFSTEYTYDILSRLTSIKRHGVVDIEGDTEVFGILDDITLTYSGAVLARMQSNFTEETGRNFYGRTGWSEGTFMPSATVSYNAAGRLASDSGRMLGAVSYNTIGLPTRYSTGGGSSASTSPRKERCYDATGRKLRQTEYEAVRGKMTKTSDRRYVGSMTFNADTLERVDFTGGYFDGRGAAHYLFTDWQGNVTITTDAAGKIEQHIGYYPYGEPWREPSGQRATLFAGKERLSGQAAGDFDFGPRGYRPTIAYWDSPDRLAHKTPGISPWAYCAGNPIRYTDFSGDTIRVRDKSTNSELNWLEKDGKWDFYDSNQNAYTGDDKSVATIKNALENIMNGGPSGDELVSSIANDKRGAKISISNKKGSDTHRLLNLIYWDKNGARIPTTKGYQTNPIIDLVHELAHIQYNWNVGKYDSWNDVKLGNGKIITVAEIYTTHIENKIRAEQGLPLRTHYTYDDDGRKYGQIINNDNKTSRYVDALGNINYTPLSSEVKPYKYY